MSIIQKSKDDIINEATLEKSDGIISSRDPRPRDDKAFDETGLPQWNVNLTYPNFFLESGKKFEFLVTDIASGKIDKQEFIVPANNKFLIVRIIMAVVDGELPQKQE